MLIPRFSLRWLLLLMTAFAVFFLVMRWAGQGSHWAVGTVTAVIALALAMLIYGVFFGLAFLLSGIQRRLRPARLLVRRLPRMGCLHR